MISNERLEIIKYIMKKKNISIDLLEKVLNVLNLKDMTMEQAFALEQLLSLFWNTILDQ